MAVAGKDLIRESQKERTQKKNSDEGIDLEFSCMREGNNGGDLCVLVESGE